MEALHDQYYLLNPAVANATHHAKLVLIRHSVTANIYSLKIHNPKSISTVDTDGSAQFGKSNHAGLAEDSPACPPVLLYPLLAMPPKIAFL